METDDLLEYFPPWVNTQEEIRKYLTLKYNALGMSVCTKKETLKDDTMVSRTSSNLSDDSTSNSAN